MRMLTAITLALLASLLSTSWAETVVWPVGLNFKGTVPDNINGQPALSTVKVNGDELLNIARGRSAEADVPPEEVLALAIDCVAHTATLIVYHNPSGVGLATVGTTREHFFFEDANRGQFVTALELQETGSSTNKIVGGYLVLAGSYSRDPQGCRTGLKATLVGFIEVLITDDIGTHGLGVVITKAKFKLGKAPIGTLP